jgi:hypothetical protein
LRRFSHAIELTSPTKGLYGVFGGAAAAFRVECQRNHAQGGEKRAPNAAFPKNWTSRGRSAVLHVISQARFAYAYTRGGVASVLTHSAAGLKPDVDTHCPSRRPAEAGQVETAVGVEVGHAEACVEVRHIVQLDGNKALRAKAVGW